MSQETGIDPKCEDFLNSHPAPADYNERLTEMSQFCVKHNHAGSKIVLITSGGTIVPLEHNTVRYLDNFSAGTRGALSAEYFLKKNYAVIFLHRGKSVKPFLRHFHAYEPLEALEFDGTGIRVKPEAVAKVAPVLREYQRAVTDNQLLFVQFASVSEYLWLLKAACHALSPLGKRAVLYLAAAVSDFYIPPSEMPTHKIQSSSGEFSLSLKLIPKMLSAVVNVWVPDAFVISFKLETDEAILVQKAQWALKRYNHDVVIANLLQTRKQKVVFVTQNQTYVIALTDGDLSKNVEIEEMIIKEIVDSHQRYVTQSRDDS